MAFAENTDWPRRRAILPLVLLTMANGPSLPAPAKFSASQAIVLVCTVTGAQHVRPAASAAQVCAAFKRGLDSALGRATRMASAPPTRGEMVKVAVNIPGPRGASARVLTRASGVTAQWPEFAMDVMDKSLSIQEIERLARDVGRSIKGD